MPPIRFLFSHDNNTPHVPFPPSAQLRLLQAIGAYDKSTLNREELFNLVDIGLEQGAVSRAHSPEITANLRTWHALAAMPSRWSRQWAVQAVAAAERLSLTLSNEADSLVKLIQV